MRYKMKHNNTFEFAPLHSAGRAHACRSILR
jgi:hypothetical protein